MREPIVFTMPPAAKKGAESHRSVACQNNPKSNFEFVSKKSKTARGPIFLTTSRK
jgi:hypothetical protein